MGAHIEREEGEMFVQPALANTVGFRHVLEDGLSILEGEELPATRRTYVLNRLQRFIEDARRGSNLISENAWVIAPSDRDALQSFSFFDSYLSGYDTEDLVSSLADAQQSVDSLVQNAAVPQPVLSRTQRLLKDLLDCIEQDARNGIPSKPRDIYLGSIGS